jgi:hypothetical protein
MASRLCDTSAVQRLLDLVRSTGAAASTQLRGGGTAPSAPGAPNAPSGAALSAAEGASREAGTVVSVVREARTLAASASARTEIVRASAVPGPDRERGIYIEGVRNRLFLKYLGVDYEYFGSDVMIYRE